MDFQLVVTRGRSASQSLKLQEGVTTLGRQDDCHLRIASSQVSRRHCQLFEHKGFLLVKDLGSSNGTYVNGAKIAEQRVLEPGDELGIGPVKFRVEKKATAATAAAPAKAAGDTAIVEVLDDPPVEAPALEAPVAQPVVETAPAPPADIDEEAAIAIGDDDVFEIDFDEEVAEPIDVPAARPVAPPVPAAVAEQSLPEATKEKDLGEDAVADFLMNLEIDDEK